MREVMKLIGLDLRDDSLEENTKSLSQNVLLMKFFSGMDLCQFPENDKNQKPNESERNGASE